MLKIFLGRPFHSFSLGGLYMDGVRWRGSTTVLVIIGAVYEENWLHHRKVRYG